jgi:hypothetical protein
MERTKLVALVVGALVAVGVLLALYSGLRLGHNLGGAALGAGGAWGSTQQTAAVETVGGQAADASQTAGGTW